MLRVIQLNTLEDRCIKEKHNWDEAAQFLISSLEQNLKVMNYFCILTQFMEYYYYYYYILVD